jgi:hypothetical protein
LTKNFYELLGVAATAESEEIKRAFRREIARYHPDKVQHLGQEFQEIASSRAAALTEAYRILMDADARRRYDAAEGTIEAPPAGGQAARPASAPADVGSGTHDRPDARVQHARATTSEFVTKAALRMVKEAIARVVDGATDLPARGFDAGYVVKGKRSLFGKKEPVIRLLAKFVPQVNSAAVDEAWPLAVGATGADQTACVLLLGSGLAPSKELATAVAELRRRTRTAAPVIVPVDVRDWDALLPPEVPPAVRAVLQALKDGKG